MVPPDGTGRFMGDFYRSFVGEQNQTASSRAASTPPWCSHFNRAAGLFYDEHSRVAVSNAIAIEFIKIMFLRTPYSPP